MDALKLRLRAKDQLHPILQELVTGYARFKGSKDWEGRSKMVSWCVPFCCMPVFDILGSHYQAYYLEQHEGIRRNHRRTVPAGKFTTPGDGSAFRADIYIAFI